MIRVSSNAPRLGIKLTPSRPATKRGPSKITLHGCFVHCIEEAWYIFRTKKPTAGKLMKVSGIEKFPTRTYLERLLGENGWFIDHMERIRAIKGRLQTH